MAARDVVALVSDLHHRAKLPTSILVRTWGINGFAVPIRKNTSTAPIKKYWGICQKNGHGNWRDCIMGQIMSSDNIQTLDFNQGSCFHRNY